MKYLSLIALFLLLSCGNKEDILLPKSNTTIVKEVLDHSPIYLFFRKNEKDTLVEVNKKNEIISTNWIFNVDKRLPLRLVIPEIIKLQEKKRNEKAHKNEAAENYYSYADTIGKNLAFLPFTSLVYQMQKPATGTILFFTKNNSVEIEGKLIQRGQLQNYLNNKIQDPTKELFIAFDKNLSFGNYIQNKIWIQKLIIKNKAISINSNSEYYY